MKKTKKPQRASRRAAPPCSALKYLLAKEWSMGNGQCPECEGVHEGWFPHPLHATADTLGHKNSCKLAASIAELGGTPLFVGQSKPKGEYRFGLRDVPPGKNGTLAECFCMIPASEPLSKRELAFRESCKPNNNSATSHNTKEVRGEA